MFKTFFVYLKYPATAGVIATIWLGTMVLLVTDPTLPVFGFIFQDVIATIVIAYVGFRVDKK